MKTIEARYEGFVRTTVIVRLTDTNRSAYHRQHLTSQRALRWLTLVVFHNYESVTIRI